MSKEDTTILEQMIDIFTCEHQKWSDGEPMRSVRSLLDVEEKIPYVIRRKLGRKGAKKDPNSFKAREQIIPAHWDYKPANPIDPTSRQSLSEWRAKAMHVAEKVERKTERSSATKVMCVETGQWYASYSDAAQAINGNPTNVRNSAREGRTHKGFHWVVEGQIPVKRMRKQRHKYIKKGHNPNSVAYKPVVNLSRGLYFPSLGAAAKAIGCYKIALSHSIHKNGTYKKERWCFVGDMPLLLPAPVEGEDKMSSSSSYYSHDTRRVAVMCVETGVTYSSKYEAATALGDIGYFSSIRRAANTGLPFVKLGLHFMWLNKPQELGTPSNEEPNSNGE